MNESHLLPHSQPTVPFRPSQRTWHGGKLLSFDLAPLPDETFGSWLRRLACLYDVRRGVLVRALLAEVGEAMPEGVIDWDLDPPKALLDILAERLAFPPPIDELIPARTQDHLRVHERGVYCPECWLEESHAGLAHERRSHLDAWCVTCLLHDELLNEFGPSAEETLHFFCPRWGERAAPWAAKRLARRPQQIVSRRDRLSEEARHSMHLTKGLYATAHGALSELTDSGGASRAQILRDIILMTACDVEGVTLLEFVHPGRGQWAWQRDDASRAPWPVAAPLGSVYLRQEAIRLGAVIWRWLSGDVRADERDDLIAYTVLCEVRPRTIWGCLVNRMTAGWGEAAREIWARTFDQPWLRGAPDTLVYSRPFTPRPRGWGARNRRSYRR